MFADSFDVAPMELGGFDVVVFYKEFAPLELAATVQPAQAGRGGTVNDSPVLLWIPAA